MNRLLKKLSSTLGIVMILTVISSAFPFAAEAEEQFFIIADVEKL